ncbi:MAG: Tol-Pal system beta propeller repeat protein TolB [Neomegalonema sp.]|nr:Tol-Pal system beta propeller repeat protein TolB [Neomegalonema sp.]
MIPSICKRRGGALAQIAGACLLAAASQLSISPALAQSEEAPAKLKDAPAAPTKRAPAATPAPVAPGAPAATTAVPYAGRTSITVKGGEFKPIPVALPRFRAAAPSDEPLAIQISDVIAADLARSGLFTVIGGPPLDSIGVPPDMKAWAARGASALIAGEALLEPDGRLGARIRLWDLALSEQRKQLRFLAAPYGWRRVAHKIADIVYTELTGEKPYFDTRIVFVEERGPKAKRTKRLAIMDSDGENVTYLTTDQNLVLTPRFSPVSQEITFVSDASGKPEVYLLNLKTERQERLGVFPGMTFAPRFSPDGERVVMSFTKGGDTDIYILELATRRKRRLTSSAGIDTAPSFAPDGSKIVFESGRSGGQQIYVMDSDGSNQKRISAGPGSYGTPVWSPKGDLIAFTKRLKGKFHIGVMRPDGSEERLLTSSYLDEGPTWAPNGRVIMFFREPRSSKGTPKLYTVDVFGRGERHVPTPHGASDPAWSPLLGK